MQMYNATIELDGDAETHARGDTMERYAQFHAVLTRSTLGRGELILSAPAESMHQAVRLFAALVVDEPVTRLVVESSEDFDRRGESEVPPLLTVTETAERLGITRAGVQKRLDAGTLPGVKVGSTWVIPAAAVTRD